MFFQRSPGRGLGKDVHSFDFQHKGKSYEYLYIEDEKGLLEIIQMGAIEIHPWGASVDAIDYPDRLIFDLDPAPDVPFEALKLAAADLRQRLKKKGLDSRLKCTGGKGCMLPFALAGKDRWPAVKAFGAAVAQEMVSAVPEAYVATMSKAKRTGKIFIDYFRNDYTATAIADYGVRARPGAPVAVPLAWEELKGLESASAFTMKDVLKRLKNRKPPAQPKGQPTAPSCNQPLGLSLQCSRAGRQLFLESRDARDNSTRHKSSVALILIDVINHFEFPDGDKILKNALPMADRLAKLKKRCRRAGIPAIYVNDNFGQWRSDAKNLVSICLASRCAGRPLRRAPSARRRGLLRAQADAFGLLSDAARPPAALSGSHLFDFYGARDEQLHRLHGARRQNAEFQSLCSVRLFGGADAP